MTFVVVYLIGAREFVVVLDTWIQDFNKAKLMNYGVNSNQDFRVFWSAKNGHPNFEANIEFNAALENVFHADGEVCYAGRVKKCFGKYFQLCTFFFV